MPNLGPSALQAGSRGISCHACLVSSTHQDAELGSILLAPPWHLGGHSDNCINFLITVAPVPVSGNPQFDTGSQSQEDEPDSAAPGCLQFADSCLFLEPRAPASRNLCQHLACATRGGCEPRQRSPKSSPGRDPTDRYPVAACVGKGYRKTRWHGLITSWAFLKKNNSSGADVMTQLKGLLLAEGAQAHPLQSGGSVPLPYVYSNVPTLNGSSAQPNPLAEPAECGREWQSQ